MNTPKIEVDLNPNPDDNETPYFYVILDWSDGPTWEGNHIIPGSERGGWFNAGISGWAKTPEEAFAEGLKRFREKVKYNAPS